MHTNRVSQELKAAKQGRMIPGPKPENQNELPGNLISIQQKLLLIRASQTGEFILHHDQKRGDPFLLIYHAYGFPLPE